MSVVASETLAHFITVAAAILYITNLTVNPSEILAHTIAICTAVYDILGVTETKAHLRPLAAALNLICLKLTTGILSDATTVLLDATGEQHAGTGPVAAVYSAIATILRRSFLIQHVFVAGTRLGERVCQAPVFALAAIHCHCDIRDNVGVRRVVFLRGNASNSCVLLQRVVEGDGGWGCAPFSVSPTIL